MSSCMLMEADASWCKLIGAHLSSRDLAWAHGNSCKLIGAHTSLYKLMGAHTSSLELKVAQGSSCKLIYFLIEGLPQITLQNYKWFNLCSYLIHTAFIVFYWILLCFIHLLWTIIFSVIKFEYLYGIKKVHFRFLPF